MNLDIISLQESNLLKTMTPKLRKDKKIDKICKIHQTYALIKKQLEKHKRDGQIQKAQLKKIKNRNSELTQLAFDQIRKCHQMSFESFKKKEAQENPERQNEQYNNYDLSMNATKNNVTKSNSKKHESVHPSIDKKHALDENSLNTIEDKNKVYHKFTKVKQSMNFSVITLALILFSIIMYLKWNSSISTKIRNF